MTKNANKAVNDKPNQYCKVPAPACV